MLHVMLSAYHLIHTGGCISSDISCISILHTSMHPTLVFPVGPQFFPCKRAQPSVGLGRGGLSPPTAGSI